MLARMKPILGATLVGTIIGHLGTTTLFYPAMDAVGSGSPFPPLIANDLVASFVYVLIAVLFLDWVVQKAGRPMFNAMVMAGSQILIVDVNYVMIGRRALQPALISVVIILLLFAGAAFTYEKLSD